MVIVPFMGLVGLSFLPEPIPEPIELNALTILPPLIVIVSTLPLSPPPIPAPAAPELPPVAVIVPSLMVILPLLPLSPPPMPAAAPL
jgi:hypothetical protein